MVRTILPILVTLLLTLVGAPALGQVDTRQTFDDFDDGESGMYSDNMLGVRIIPAGALLKTDVGYRAPLTTKNSTLLKETNVSGGGAMELSPAFLWGGIYIDALPIRVLRLRASVHRATYFGTYGHPADAFPTEDGFDVPVLRQRNDPGDGRPASGWIHQINATPRVMWKGIVVIAPTSLVHMTLTREGYHHEPKFDIVMDTPETMFEIKPTLGYQFDLGSAGGELMLGARFDHTRAFRSKDVTDVVLGLAVWDIPENLIAFGDPRVAAVAGGWTNHATRRGDPYVGFFISSHVGAEESD